MAQAKYCGSNAPGKAEERADPHHQANHQHVKVVTGTFLQSEEYKFLKTTHGIKSTFNLCSFLLTMTEVIC